MGGDVLLYIDGGDIYIHRGDSATFDIIFGDPEGIEPDENQIRIADLYGSDFVPEDGTSIRFSVKVDTDKYRYLIQKDYVVWNGFVCIDLLPSDTRCLPSAEYKWDVRLSFENAGIIEWNTPLNPFSFFVTEVVSNGN